MTYRSPHSRNRLRTDLDSQYGACEPVNFGPEIFVDGHPAGGHVIAAGIDTRMTTRYGTYEIGQRAEKDPATGAITAIHFSING